MNIYMSASGIDLQDRIYFLQRTCLPIQLNVDLIRADTLYLQDKDDDAADLVGKIEEECAKLGIKIYQPMPVNVKTGDAYRQNAIECYEAQANIDV